MRRPKTHGQLYFDNLSAGRRLTLPLLQIPINLDLAYLENPEEVHVLYTPYGIIKE